MADGKEPLNPFYDAGNDVERIFISDVVEKKVAGRGIHARAKRLRKHESLIMPSERLSGIEKIDYTKGGIVTLSKIGDREFMEILTRIKSGEIPSTQEIDKIAEDTNFETAQKIVAEIRRLHKNDVLKDAWNLKYGNFNKYVYDKYQTARTRNGQVFVGEMAVKYVQQTYYNEAGISKKLESISKHNTTVKTPKVKEEIEEVVQAVPVIQQPAVVVAPVLEGFNIVIKKSLESKELESLLTRLSMFVTKDKEGEEQPLVNYDVEIVIKTA